MEKVFIVMWHGGFDWRRADREITTVPSIKLLSTGTTHGEKRNTVTPAVTWVWDGDVWIDSGPSWMDATDEALTLYAATVENYLDTSQSVRLAVTSLPDWVKDDIDSTTSYIDEVLDAGWSLDEECIVKTAELNGGYQA